MRPLSRVRFNALAGYARRPMAVFFAEEVAWFEHGSERVLGAVLRDRTDNDFTGMVMARDRRGRFRAVDFTSTSELKRRRAEILLRREMERLAMAPDAEYYQGDEVGTPLDFFSPRAERGRLHRHFLALTEGEGFSAARGIIEPMMHWYEDPDGNLIEQFQTTGFDARLWELYLFAAFSEAGYQIDRIHAVPDFACQGLAGEFAVEAMTVNPTQDNKGAAVASPPRRTPEEHRSFVRDYMPIKFGSTLTSKLAKKYWESPSAANKPLLFAIQDFSAPGSMVYTRTPLMRYLYGREYEWEHDGAGRLKVTSKRIETHGWGDKEIPSGFFDLPGVENLSAVIFNNSATISKFNRMGLLAEFGSKRLVLVREGTAYNPNPNSVEPRQFSRIVGAPGYVETWVEGLDVFHNPKAKYPFDPRMLPAAAHHRLLDDGRMASVTPDWHPLGSVTRIIVADSEEEAQRVIQETNSRG
jgi:hypothetical protein